MVIHYIGVSRTIFVTNHRRSTKEGNVFSSVCHSVLIGGPYPMIIWDRILSFQEGTTRKDYAGRRANPEWLAKKDRSGDTYQEGDPPSPGVTPITPTVGLLPIYRF